MKFWGDLSCLYGTLDPSQVSILEEAISAHHRGFLVDAEEIILNQLAPVERHPVIAITLADIYESQGLERTRAEVLHRTLLGHAAWSTDAVGNERLLLKILHAGAILWCDGLMRTSLKNVVDETTIRAGFSLLTASEVEVRVTTSMSESC